jgi:hypothetical protein
MGAGQTALRATLSAYNTGNHRAGITHGDVARVSAAARPERSVPIAPPLRMAAISAGEASISPRVFWEKRP